MPLGLANLSLQQPTVALYTYINFEVCSASCPWMMGMPPTTKLTNDDERDDLRREDIHIYSEVPSSDTVAVFRQGLQQTSTFEIRTAAVTDMIMMS